MECSSEHRATSKSICGYDTLGDDKYWNTEFVYKSGDETFDAACDT